MFLYRCQNMNQCLKNIELMNQVSYLYLVCINHEEGWLSSNNLFDLRDLKLIKSIEIQGILKVNL